MGRADVEGDVAAVNAAGGNVAHTFQLQEDGYSFVVNVGDTSGTITVSLDVDDYPKHTWALFAAEGDIEALEKLAATLQQRFCGGGRLIDIEQFVRQSTASPPEGGAGAASARAAAAAEAEAQKGGVFGGGV